MERIVISSTDRKPHRLSESAAKKRSAWHRTYTKSAGQSTKKRGATVPNECLIPLQCRERLCSDFVDFCSLIPRYRPSPPSSHRGRCCPSTNALSFVKAGVQHQESDLTLWHLSGQLTRSSASTDASDSHVFKDAIDVGRETE